MKWKVSFPKFSVFGSCSFLRKAVLANKKPDTKKKNSTPIEPLENKASPLLAAKTLPWKMIINMQKQNFQKLIMPLCFFAETGTS